MEKQLLLLSIGEDTVRHVRKTLEPLKYKITVKNRLSSGLKAMNGRELVLLDLPDSVSALKEIKSYCPEATVLVTAPPEQAQLALDDGAYHFFRKPINAHELKTAVKNASQSISMRDRLEKLKAFGPPKLILGMGPAMRKVLRQIERAAYKDVPVLIIGEHGTGKMLVAEAIHSMSGRRHGPYVTAGGPGCEILAALIGNIRQTDVLYDLEDGTLFIKEIHRLGQAEQKKLASLFRNGIPGPDGKRTKVRVIASTEPYGKEWPFSGCFRTILNLPPLKERKEDIKPLAEHFLQEAAEIFSTGQKTFSQDAMKAIKAHKWPGNVGELKLTVRRACVLSGGETVEPHHITTSDGTTFCTIKDFLEAKLSRYIKDIIRLDETGLHKTVMEEVEKSLLDLVLRETGGNQVRAARAMGVTRTTLRSKIKNYGLDTRLQKKNA